VKQYNVKTIHNLPKGYFSKIHTRALIINTIIFYNILIILCESLLFILFIYFSRTDDPMIDAVMQTDVVMPWVAQLKL
jgi:hypothetical protein